MSDGNLQAISMLIRPFVFLALALLVLYPARRAVEKYMKDGKLKRLLLRKIS